MSIGSATFARLTIETDRQTDHTTPSVTTGHIYVRSTVMRPKNPVTNEADNMHDCCSQESTACSQHNTGRDNRRLTHHQSAQSLTDYDQAPYDLSVCE